MWAQVQARIERAWVRPRSEIGAPSFSCTARIEQNRWGEIAGIQLAHCNGTDRWQQSLVSAMRTASPLPAPPDPTVYTDALWLNFGSEGFRSDGSAEGFEPESPHALAVADLRQSRPPYEHFARQLGGKVQPGGNDSSDVFYLTIVGNPADAVPPPASGHATSPVPRSEHTAAPTPPQ